MLGFVDDSNGQTNDFLPDAQIWNDVLQVSGGALELSKCSYHVLHWEFRPDGTPYFFPGTLGDPVKVTTYDRQELLSEATLTPLSVSQSHKTLGTYQTPNGEMLSQLCALKMKAEKFANLVKSSYFTRQEAWTFYFAIFLPSLSYPLATSHFTPLPLIEVHRIAMPAIIFSKCGYNQKTKRDILYGPVRLGGAGFRDLSVVQGISQLATFIRHWRKPDSQAGKLVLLAVAWMQFIVGTGIPLLYHTQAPMPHLESQWIKSLRDFLARIQAKLDLAETFIPSIPREKDAFIMDLVLQGGQFTNNKEVQRINYCRLYLQAMFLSDI